jgi:peptidoglycan/LPS O-acetylase OafA/YrhL
LAGGALIALYVTSPGAALDRLAKLASVAFYVLLPVAAIVLVWRYGAGRTINDAGAPAGVDSALVYSLTASVFVSLLALVVSRPTSLPGRLASARWLRWLGQISYGLYLIHLPVFELSSAIHPTALWSKAICMALAVVAALGLAQLSWKYFETPFVKLKPPYG